MKKGLFSPLKVYIVWDKAFDIGLNLAKSVYNKYNRSLSNPASKTIGIPVGFIDTPEKLSQTLSETYETKLYFIIFDENFIYEAKPWNYIIENIKSSKTTIIPIMYEDNEAYMHFSSLNSVNFALLEPKFKSDRFMMICGIEITRSLLKMEDNETDDLKIFISHAKNTGEEQAKKLQNIIEKDAKIDSFFDERNIKHGERFDLTINNAIEESLVLAVLTDGYSSREWCRRELYEAKKHGRPIILLDDYKQGEFRLFPYLGNVKIMRLPQQINRFRLITSILLENIQVLYHKLHTNYLMNLLNINMTNKEIINSKPELLSVGFHKNKYSKETLFLYPDPPVSNDEIDILKGFCEPRKYTTPLLYFSSKNNEYSLRDLKIGLSISYPFEGDEDNIYNTYITQDIMVALSRYLLASNAKLFYAGDPNYESELSFSQVLINVEDELYRSTNNKDKMINLVLPNYINKKIKTRRKNQLNKFANIIEGSPKLKNKKEELYETRKLLIDSIAALIIVGGKRDNQHNCLPGIIEEIDLAIKKEIPIFLLGGFGGIAYDLTESIVNGHKLYNKKYNLKDLNNPLSKEQNLKLFNEQNLDIIIATLLQGLGAISKNN